MKTPTVAPFRSWLAALAAVVLLALMAAPAEAQRGFGGRGHGHHGSGHGGHFSGGFGQVGHFGFFGGRFGGHFGFGRHGEFGHFGFGRQARFQPHFPRRQLLGRSHRGQGPYAYFGPFAWYSPYTWYGPADRPGPRVYDWAASGNPGAGAPQGPYIEVGGYLVRNLAWEAAMSEAEREAEGRESAERDHEARPEPADRVP